LWTALMDPDPVILFENALLYNLSGELDADAGAVDIERAAIRREGTDITVVTYGGSLGKTLEAATQAASQGVAAEVIDLRSLRPLDMGALLESLAKTHRMVIVDEGWKSGSLSAEIMARVMENAFYELDAPIARVCSAEVPVPYARHLEEAAIPQVPGILDALLRTVAHRA
jgi:pyruvate/2-oxoglutarate/acetoin dehydrogenase E1 component